MFPFLAQGRCRPLFGTSITFLVLQSALSSMTVAQPCPVRLPQNVPSDSSCAQQRRKELAVEQATYRLTSDNPTGPFALVDLSPAELTEIIRKDPFMRPYALQYRSLIAGVSGVLRAYVNRTEGQQISGLGDFAGIRQHFRLAVQDLFGEFARLPSDYEPFQNNVTEWISDEFYAQQRLAGVNPMSLQVVSYHSKNVAFGLDWTKLKKELNPSFDWQRAFGKALGVHCPLNEAIFSGRVYVLRYPLCDNLPTQDDVTDFDPTREMRRPQSPVALFVSAPDAPGGLRPVAIQVDYTPGSPVFTPEDGDDWTIAKLTVQTADLAHGQIVEHLARCHFLSEALCVAMKRHFPSQHPVRQVMKFHCREVLVPNVFGAPSLVSDQGFMRMLFAMGSRGVTRLIRRAYGVTDWGVTDFRANVKKRGMANRHRVPYFPYRDDGDIIYAAIQSFVGDYVNLYYKTDDDIRNDLELQAFANEVSAEGTVKPDGGKGQIKRFPAQIICSVELQDVLTRWIWQLVGQHSSVSYGLSEYASYTPNLPTKTYTDKRPHAATFGHRTFANRYTAALQASFTMKLSSFRFDRLLSYGSLLDDNTAGNIVNYHHWLLVSEVQEQLERRNDARKAAGQLTYPQLLPRWLPNGIQT